MEKAMSPVVLLAWTGNGASYRDYLKSVWTADVLNGASFNKAVQDGVFVSSSSGNGANGTSTIELTSTELKDKKGDPAEKSAGLDLYELVQTKCDIHS